MKVYYMIAGRLINRIRKNRMTAFAKTVWEARFLPVSSGRELSYKIPREPEPRARRTQPFIPKSRWSLCFLLLARLGCCEVYSS